MALTIIYLGTAAAVPAPGRDNTSLALDDGHEVTLVDASGSPAKRLAEAGLDPVQLRRVIITHQHLDHVFGLPSLLQSLWLMGRRDPLDVHALPETWAVLERLIDVYRPSSWTDAFPVVPRAIEVGDTPFIETPWLSATAARLRHSVPSVGLRVTAPHGGVMAYSSDTAPCEATARLAAGCDLLVHEATFLTVDEAAARHSGHSTAEQAARIAVEASASRLALVHFTPRAPGDLAILAEEARRVFPGPIFTPRDYDRDGVG